MYKVEDFITHINNEEDIPFLKVPLHDVNMRLFKSSPYYKKIIHDICAYIRFLALTKLEGYSKPYGMSGANAGIPFNIIGIIRNRERPNESCEIMINPKIISYGEEKALTETNCGSIRLKEPIKIERSKIIHVKYFTETGNPIEQTFGPALGSYTIQHEVDHNLGKLITSYKIHF